MQFAVLNDPTNHNYCNKHNFRVMTATQNAAVSDGMSQIQLYSYRRSCTLRSDRRWLHTLFVV